LEFGKVTLTDTEVNYQLVTIPVFWEELGIGKRRSESL